MSGEWWIPTNLQSANEHDFLCGCTVLNLQAGCQFAYAKENTLKLCSHLRRYPVRPEREASKKPLGYPPAKYN